MPTGKPCFEADVMCGWPRKFVMYTARSSTAFGAFRQVYDREGARFYKVDASGKRKRIRVVADGRYQVRVLPFGKSRQL